MDTSQWYALILAGGKGERLWPLSRQAKPKQLLPFANNHSLLEQTIDRIAPLIPKERIWVVTTQMQKEQITRMIGEKVGTIIAEPAARNTGPAITWACLQLQQYNPQAVALFLSADHYIKEQDLFLQTIAQAAEYAQTHDCITLLGLKPTYPATGYGYIEHDWHDSHHVHPVKRFHEKPSEQQAKQYILSDNMLWNSGMFCGKASIFLTECKQHAPQLYHSVCKFVDEKISYNAIEKISIDHALMEKSTTTCVIPATFCWSDVGNLEVFLQLQGKTQNTNPTVYTFEANDNLVHAAGKPVALIGVDDLCIVDTPDALLIAKRQDVEKVKLILEQLRAQQKNELL